jgi:translation initiation factor 4E
MAGMRGGTPNPPCFSFNETFGGGMTAIPGVPDVEDPEFVAALAEPVPLSCGWALWEQVSGGSYSTRKVASFDNVQAFWSIMNGIPQPSELIDGKKFMRAEPGERGYMSTVEALMIFREGIKPEWEDHANAQGGHFQITLKAGANGGQVDEYWNNIVLGMIGNTMEAGSKITGVRLVDKLATRTKPTDHFGSSSGIGRRYHRRSLQRCDRAWRVASSRGLTAPRAAC